MRTRVTHACDLPYGPGDNPYAHWARCLAPPDADEPLCDGRRLRRSPGRGEVAALPLVVLLDGEPGSPRRRAARRALAEAVEAGRLRMDAHERAALRARSSGEEAREPDAAREIHCLYRPLPSAPLPKGVLVVEQGAPVSLARHPAPEANASPEAPEPGIGAVPVMAVIDDGVAFLNARFRRADGGTRFEAVWMQGHRPFPGFEAARGWPFGGAARPGFGARGATETGAVLERGDIDHLLAAREALDEAAAYRRLSRAVNDDPDARHALEGARSHGTHVTDLAAGADPHAEAEPDVRRWPLLAVQLPPEAVSDTAGQDLRFLAVAGVRWILHRARRLGTGPVIVTISFGALAGPKDGSRAIEWAIDQELALFEAATGRAARVNWAFGNARLNSQVAWLDAAPEQGPIDWRLQPDDQAASFLEIRPDRPGRLSRLALRIALPGGRVETLRVRDPRRPVTLEIDGRPALRLYRAPAPGGRGASAAGRAVAETPHLVLAAAPTAPAMGREPRAPAGAYGLTLRWTRGPWRWRRDPSPVRLEVQRGDTPVGHPAYGRQSYLDHPLAYSHEEETEAATSPSGSPITRAGTHSANAHPASPRVWTTGAARPGRTAGAPRPTRYAAAGRLDSPVLGPTISALAERGPGLGGVLASGTLSGAVAASGGSSAAAPLASRALALLLAEGAGAGGAAPDQAGEAREVAARWGVPTDPGREGLPPTDPDHLETPDKPEPGDAARLGAGTVTAEAGRRWE